MRCTSVTVVTEVRTAVRSVTMQITTT